MVRATVPPLAHARVGPGLSEGSAVRRDSEARVAWFDAAITIHAWSPPHARHRFGPATDRRYAAARVLYRFDDDE
jgi:hypothetical protein